MSLSAIPLALVVPPTSLLLPCVLGWLLRRHRLGRALLAFGLGGLLLLSLPVVSKALIWSLERDLPFAGGQAAERNPPGAIVILSGDISRNAGTLDVGSLTLERERTGAALQRRTHLPVLVTGGDVNGVSLAKLMADSLAADFNIPVRWIEPVARDTRENAILSAAMLRKDGVTSVYLVTHAWHMRRALLDFAQTGLGVTIAPVQIDAPADGMVADFVPRASAWLDSYFALHEWIGYVVEVSFYKWYGPPPGMAPVPH